MQIHRSCFLQLPWSAEKEFPQNPPQKSVDNGHEPYPPHNQVENATAPLRLCARTLRLRMGMGLGKAATFSDSLWGRVNPH